MKTIVKYSLAALLSIGISNTCLAVVIADSTAGMFDGTDVGFVDTLLQLATKTPSDPLSLTNLPDSGEATELAWVDLVLTDLGTDTTNLDILVKIEPAPIFTTDITNVFASNITTDPTAVADYFIVKNAKYWALFDNNIDMNWAVFNASLLPLDMNINDVTVSHISVYSNATTSVPEPSALALMGLGLLGFGFARRR